MFNGSVFVCSCICCVFRVYGYLCSVAKRRALFCVFCSLLICVLLMDMVGTVGYSRIGRTRAFTRCVFIFVGIFLNLYSFLSAYNALLFLSFACCVYHVVIVSPSVFPFFCVLNKSSSTIRSSSALAPSLITVNLFAFVLIFQRFS